jgi:hypothetical protein
MSDRRRHIGDMTYTVVAIAIILSIAMGVSGIAPRLVALFAKGEAHGRY